MPSTKLSTRAVADEARKKAKQHNGPASASRTQKPISELFGTSKQSAIACAVEDHPSAPPSKRIKHHHVEDAIETVHGPARIMKTNEMYSFAVNPKTNTQDIVDLTSPSTSNLTRRATSQPVRGSSGTTGPKRLVIKNLKKPSGPDPKQYYTEVCRRLDTALDIIFGNDHGQYSKETLYNEVMILCRQNQAPELYKRLCTKIHETMSVLSKPAIIQSAKTQNELELLETILNAWKSWINQIDVVQSIFFFLDRSYLLHSSLSSICDIGTSEFEKQIFRDTYLEPRILQGICRLLQTERFSALTTVSDSQLHDAVNMFHVLKVYALSLEPLILAETQSFYVSWSEQTVASTDLAGYLEMCGSFFIEEHGRWRSWALDQSTQVQLNLYLEEILILRQDARLLNAADIGQLLDDGAENSLHKLYGLLQKRQIEEKLRPAFESYIVTKGSEIVFDEEHEQEMVVRLLEFKRTLDHILGTSFEMNTGLGHTLREAFETFINRSKRSTMTWGTDNLKPGEMIAKYVDVVLKGGAKAIRTLKTPMDKQTKLAMADGEVTSDDEDVEITKQLDQVLDLFRFVHGKAVFEAFYKRDLARRLLLGRSASSDAEKSMLTRLASECGAGFTHNLEQMFKDMELAREEISAYKSRINQSDQKPKFDLSVNVLSSAAWPSYPDVPVNVPEDILKATADFEQHYRIKHSGRKLEWKPALAHCQIKAIFPKGVKELVVSSFQAIVLLAFNGQQTMSYSDLQAVTGLDNTELKRTLQSLACANYRVLSKLPKSKEVELTDNFTVNDMFFHDKYRIKINQIQAKETKQENQQTHERVAADRAFETQAAIVRIMKSRKTITHAELVSDVITATKSRGPLDLTDIKKNIEKLIEKDYMERDEEKHNTYIYMA